MGVESLVVFVVVAVVILVIAGCITYALERSGTVPPIASGAVWLLAALVILLLGLRHLGVLGID